MKIDLKTQTSGQLVDALVQLDKLRLQTARSIDMYKAELQARGVSIMDDRNQQYIRFYGDGGSASITRQAEAGSHQPGPLAEVAPGRRVQEERIRNYGNQVQADHRVRDHAKSVRPGTTPSRCPWRT